HYQVIDRRSHAQGRRYIPRLVPVRHRHAGLPGQPGDFLRDRHLAGEALTMHSILCLSGSLRAASSSTAIVNTICRTLAQEARFSRFDIGSLPHYNADLDPLPASVNALKKAIAETDGVVIVTPEYNYSVPGVLKNAIDWASRPGYASVFRDKPVFIASVSGGALGGVRAQAHLKNVQIGRAHV